MASMAPFSRHVTRPTDAHLPCSILPSRAGCVEGRRTRSSANPKSQSHRVRVGAPGPQQYRDHGETYQHVRQQVDQDAANPTASFILGGTGQGAHRFANNPTQSWAIREPSRVVGVTGANHRPTCRNPSEAIGLVPSRQSTALTKLRPSPFPMQRLSLAPTCFPTSPVSYGNQVTSASMGVRSVPPATPRP